MAVQMILTLPMQVLAMGLLILLQSPGALLAAITAVLLPVMTETLVGSRRRVMACVTGAVGAGAILMWLPMPMWLPGIAWCAGVTAASLLPVQDAKRRGVVWLGLCAAEALLIAWVMMSRYHGPAAQGVAEDVTRWIDGREDAPALLWMMYQSGLAELPSGMAHVMRVGSQLVLPGEVRAELLNSLRLELSLQLSVLLPGMLTCWLLGTPLAACAAMDSARAARTGWQDLPPFERWYLPRGAGLAVGALALGFALSGGAWETVGVMCGTAFTAVYAVQGAASSWFIKEKTHRSTGAWAVLTALMALFAPVMLTVGGVMDQLGDPRRLRPRPDDEDDEE